MSSPGRAAHGTWRRSLWTVPLVPALGATGLLCAGAWQYGYHPGWFAGRLAWYQTLVEPGQNLTLIGTTLLWLAAVGAYWYPRRYERLPVTLLLIGVMAAVAAALGCASYLPCRGQVAAVGVLFWVLQLYVGQPPNVYQNVQPPQSGLAACYGPPPLGLELGQLIGLGAALVTAVTVGAVLWRQPLERLRLRLAPEVTLLTGLDALTLQLLRQLARTVRPGRIFVVEPDETHLLLDEARATGARVLVGEPDWPRLLRWAVRGWHGCALRHLYALQGDSTQNEEILAQAELVLAAHPPGRGRLPQLVIRIDDPRHAGSWRGRHGGGARLRLADALSPAEATAYALIDSILRTPARHLVLCGDSSLVIALLTELDRRTWERHALDRAALAGQRGTAAEQVRDTPLVLPVAKVTLVDPTAADTCREYAAGSAPGPGGAAPGPAARPGSSTELVPCLDRWQDALLGLLDAMSAADARDTAIVIVNSFTEADRQAAGRASRIYPGTAVYLEVTAGDGVTEPVFDQLRLFRLGLLVAGEVPEDTWTRVARHWHECHRLENPVPDGHPRAFTRVPWADLDPVIRHDNMLQVRSILSEVADRLGRVWLPVRMVHPGSFVELGPSEVDQVAAAEYERWYARRKELRLLSESDQPWAALPAAGRQRAADELRKQLDQLERAGFLPVIPRGGPDGAGRFERTGTVQATQLGAPYTWSARSGERMQGNAGDWRVCDRRDAVRTISDPEFQATHEPISPGQWRRTGQVRAWPATEELVIRSKEGHVTAEPGDWVVEGPGGERWPVHDAQFQRTYRRLDDGPPETPAGAGRVKQSEGA